MMKTERQMKPERAIMFSAADMLLISAQTLLNNIKLGIIRKQF